MVAGPRGVDDFGHQRIHVVGHHGGLAQRRQGFASAPTVVALQAETEVGFFQRPWQLRLHRAEFHGVGTRLEGRQDARLQADFAAQAVERGAHGSRVVGEVVVDLDATHFATQLHAAAHVLEGRQRGAGGVCRHAHMLSGTDGRQRVHLVVLAQQRPFHAAQLQAAAQHVKSLRLAARTQAAGLFSLGAEALHLAPAAARQHAGQGLVARVDEQAAARWHGAHKVVELRLDAGQVGEYVGVVVFEVVEDHSARPVVDKLAALVEQRGVVLVGFDDEARTLAEPRRNAEVEGHAANQKARLVLWTGAGLVEDPRQHGRGRGLAMRAGHGQHMTAEKHVFGQPLRAAGVGRAGVEDRLHQRVAARHHIADDEHVGRKRELVRVKALDQFDAQGVQLLTHRRIDTGIAASDLVAGLARERRQAAHESAADAEDVKVHAIHSRSRLHGDHAAIRGVARTQARNASRAAATVAAMSSAVCAALTKPAS